jgi:MFS family permease
VVAVISVLSYIVGYAVGLGAVAWVVLSEIVPTRIRGKAFSLFVSVNWLCNLVISLLTLSGSRKPPLPVTLTNGEILYTVAAIDGLGGVTSTMDDDSVLADHQKRGVSLLYVVFGTICVLNILFLQRFVPETKGGCCVATYGKHETTEFAGKTLAELAPALGMDMVNDAGEMLLKPGQVSSYYST